MSLAATRWAMQVQSVGLVPKMVLLVLADHADDAGRCWPSIARICTLGRIKERAAQLAVKELVKAGLVQREERIGVGATYVLAVQPPPHVVRPTNDTPASDAPLPPHVVRGDEADPRPTCAPPPHVVRPTPALHAPEPIKEPIKEPEEVEAPPSAPPAAKPDPRGSRLPPEWQPSPADVAYAAERGLNPASVAENFRDFWHAKAGQDGRKLDWPATWRRWCRTDAEKRPQARAGPAGPQARRPATNGAVELLLRARERRAAEPEQPTLEGIAYAVR